MQADIYITKLMAIHPPFIIFGFHTHNIRRRGVHMYLRTATPRKWMYSSVWTVCVSFFLLLLLLSYILQVVCRIMRVAVSMTSTPRPTNIHSLGCARAQLYTCGIIGMYIIICFCFFFRFWYLAWLSFAVSKV